MSTDLDRAAIERVAGWIGDAQRVTVLTGAGISTDSGIPDFRGPQGVWTKNPEAERTSTLQHYLADPEVRRRSWQYRLQSPAWTAAPNAGHLAIAELERQGRLHAVVTQNIDELHQRAGTDPALVVEVHGTMWWTRCWTCGDRRPMAEALDRVRGGENDPDCLACRDAGRAGILKSDTISFGQSLVPEVIDRAFAASEAGDLLLAVGSTLSVYPAANCVPVAAAAGARVVIVNGSPTEMDRLADAVLRGPISAILPAIVGRQHGVIYHAALPADWTAAQAVGRYEVSTRGVTLADEGFVHASHEHQVERVVNAFYADVDELVLLAIDREALDVPVIEEPATGDPADERFPHVYGAIPLAAVSEARTWRRQPGAPWVLPGPNPDQTGRL